MLEDAFPEIPIVSEELVDAEGLPPSAARFWAVDPLDGTREFVAKNGEFAVCIGLVEDGGPVLGVLHGPAVGLTYAAYGPGTATRWRDGAAPERIEARLAPPRRARRRPQPLAREQPPARRVLAGLSGASRAGSCGSALKFGLIAAGEADLYPRFGTTMEWDTAAGQAILEAAGGRVETFAGTRLGYGKPGLKNDGFIAWGRAR